MSERVNKWAQLSSRAKRAVRSNCWLAHSFSNERANRLASCPALTTLIEGDCDPVWSRAWAQLQPNAVVKASCNRFPSGITAIWVAVYQNFPNHINGSLVARDTQRSGREKKNGRNRIQYNHINDSLVVRDTQRSGREKKNGRNTILYNRVQTKMKKGMYQVLLGWKISFLCALWKKIISRPPSLS